MNPNYEDKKLFKTSDLVELLDLAIEKGYSVWEDLILNPIEKESGATRDNTIAEMVDSLSERTLKVIFRNLNSPKFKNAVKMEDGDGELILSAIKSRFNISESRTESSHKAAKPVKSVTKILESARKLKVFKEDKLTLTDFFQDKNWASRVAEHCEGNENTLVDLLHKEWLFDLDALDTNTDSGFTNESDLPRELRVLKNVVIPNKQGNAEAIVRYSSRHFAVKFKDADNVSGFFVFKKGS